MKNKTLLGEGDRRRNEKRRRMAILVTDMFGTIVILLSHCKLNVLEIKH